MKPNTQLKKEVRHKYYSLASNHIDISMTEEICANIMK